MTNPITSREQVPIGSLWRSNKFKGATKKYQDRLRDKVVVRYAKSSHHVITCNVLPDGKLGLSTETFSWRCFTDHYYQIGTVAL